MDMDKGRIRHCSRAGTQGWSFGLLWALAAGRWWLWALVGFVSSLQALRASGLHTAPAK